MKLPAITIAIHTGHDPFSSMAFSANWQDETHRYHVWIGLRPDVDGERVPYPVRIGDTLYKNLIGRTKDGRHAPTIRKDLRATANAGIRSEIKRLATYDALMAMFNEKRAETEAFDTMHAEADRLNRLFDALATVRDASAEDLAIFAAKE